MKKIQEPGGAWAEPSCLGSRTRRLRLGLKAIRGEGVGSDEVAGPGTTLISPKGGLVGPLPPPHQALTSSAPDLTPHLRASALVGPWVRYAPGRGRLGVEEMDLGLVGFEMDISPGWSLTNRPAVPVWQEQAGLQGGARAASSAAGCRSLRACACAGGHAPSCQPPPSSALCHPDGGPRAGYKSPPEAGTGGRTPGS